MSLSPLDMLLMNYAAGSLTPQESLLVAAHITLNAEARRKVSRYEALGGKLMCEAEPAELHDECLNATLSRIDKTAPASQQQKAACNTASDLRIPEAVYALISSFCLSDRRDWSTVTRGFSKMDLRLCPMPTQKRLRLVKMDPGASAPRHSHPGTEVTVVLQGSYTDHTGRYNKGDIVIITDPRLIHQPVASEDGCVCLTLTEAPLRFQDPFQRFMNAFWRV